jgi:phage terminase small subunit
MKQKKSKEEREMEALMKKLRKGKKDVPNAPRYVDRTAERDWDIKDLEADALFREMKRRDF